MKIIMKIIGTVLIVLYVGYKFILSFAVSSSSHNIPITDREKFWNNFEVDFVVGAILIIAIWLNWKKIFNRRRQDNIDNI